MKKRVCALLLSWVMLVGLLPCAFAATDGFTVTGGTAGTDYAIIDGVLHIKTGTAMTVRGGTVDAPLTYSILVESGVTADLKLDGLYLTAPEYSPAIRVEKTATLNLSTGTDTVDGENTTPAAVLTGGKGRAGIEVPQTATLVVQEGDGGTLKVVAASETTSTICPAAIGESGATAGSITTSGWKYAEGVGTISIEGGKVYAECGSAAAIGGANYSENLGDIMISGGEVTVKGNPGIGTNLCDSSTHYDDRATGSVTIIGGIVKNIKEYKQGGIEAPGCDIMISGDAVVEIAVNQNEAIGDNGSTVTIGGNANVTATMDANRSGIVIGGDREATVNIEGGTVTINGNSALGIGGGTKTYRGTVNILGGTVNSEGNPAIGGDYCDVTISGGTVTATGGKAPAIGGKVQSSTSDRLYCGTVTITGGTVSAVIVDGSNHDNSCSPGIGPAGGAGLNPVNFAPEAKITITGGIVTAQGSAHYNFSNKKDSPYANGIGLGFYKGSSENTWGTGSGWFATALENDKRGSALIMVNKDENPAAADEGANGIGDSEFSLSEINNRWDGAFIVGTSGKVLGHSIFQENAALPAGATLEIPEGTGWGVAEEVTLATGEIVQAQKGGTTVTNNGTFDCYGTLELTKGGQFINGSTGVFNWYGTVNGNIDVSANGNIVNYPSRVEVTADSTVTYGDEVTFTAKISREERGGNSTIEAAGGVVDFYLDGAKPPFATVSGEDVKLENGALTAQAKVFAVGKDWKAGSTHTVTVKYRDGEGVTGDKKAQQLPAESAQGAAVTVAKKPLADAMVADIDAVTFNGKAQEPAVTVTHTVNGQNAITDKDYTLTYADNLNAGTATVTVAAADNGNYSGSVNKTFTILKAPSDPDAVTVPKNLYYAQANQVQMNLVSAASLPENRGNTTYRVAVTANADSILDGAPAENNGVLSFATKAGAEDQAATITVTAEMQNYENVTYTVNVTLKDKTLLTVSGVSIADTVDGKLPYTGKPAAYAGTPAVNEPNYGDGFDYTWYSVSDDTSTPLAEAPKTVGSYKLVVAVSDESELYRGEQVIPFEIEPALLTVTAGSHKMTKVYDGTTAAGALTGELAVSGVYGQDDVTVTAAAGAYTSANVEARQTLQAALSLSGTDAAQYTLKANTVELPALITPAPLTAASAVVSNKTYDGAAQAEVTSVSFNGLVNGENLSIRDDYTVSASFADPNAGTGKEVTVTVELKNSNYTMEAATLTASADITKATAPEAVGLSVDVANKFAKEYTLKLSKGLGALADGCQYGQVRYNASLTYEMSPDTVTVAVSGDTLTLNVGRIDRDEEYEGAFTVSVQAKSVNYTDVSFEVSVNTVSRIVPIGAPTVEGSLSYGQKLSQLPLSGTMMDTTGADAQPVKGIFAWDEPDSKPDTSATTAVWTFTPEDEGTYLALSGQAEITVAKARPAGTPTASVNTSGKTLADAGLAGEFTNPNDNTAVAGLLAWKDAPTTQVQANTAYEWTFTPADTENYESVSGRLTLWHVSSGGGSSDSSSDSSSESSNIVKNKDGSVTETVTDKRTGTVTETTTMPNGDKLVVETRKDGTVTETFTGKDGSRKETVTKADGSMTVKVTTADGVKADSAVTVQGQLTATVTIPEQAEDTTVTLPIPAAVPGRNELHIDTSVSATLLAPVQDGTPGTVAVIVGKDGSKEVIRSGVLVSGNLKFTVTGDVTIQIIDNSQSFDDVPDASWYAESVAFVSAREMLNGLGDNVFAPSAPTTRAMLMTILARYDGTDTSGGATWYEKGMAWAKEKGVSDGTLPESVITREQLATMLYRYAGAPRTSGSLSTFHDAASVSSFAQEALKWAVEQGIITGKGEGLLDPLGSATRAEVSAMLERFVRWSAT